MINTHNNKQFQDFFKEVFYLICDTIIHQWHKKKKVQRTKINL